MKFICLVKILIEVKIKFRKSKYNLEEDHILRISILIFYCDKEEENGIMFKFIYLC